VRRRRAQQVVVGIIVVGFVVATFGIVVSNPGDQATPTTPTTVPRDLDAAACAADVDRFTAAVDAADTDPDAELDDPLIADADWTMFFEGISDHCAEVGGAVSEVIVFTGGRFEGTGDPRLALSAAQLCGIGVPLSSDANAACASISELAPSLFGTAPPSDATDG
jgi:hypothetical protein